MKKILLAVIAIGCYSASWAQGGKATEPKLFGNNNAAASAANKDAEPTAEAKKMILLARQREDADLKNFKADDIAKAEDMYQKGTQSMMKERSTALLETLVKTYPQLNRAGCAQLYIAQMSLGSEKERLLKDCLERFSNSWYFDGTQVGAAAIFHLGKYYQRLARHDEANALFARLSKEFPEAVGHNGELLVNRVTAIKYKKP